MKALSGECVENMKVNNSSIKGISDEKDDQAAIRKKLGKIRAKLRSGARLTSAEMAFLRKHDKRLYMEAVAVERERVEYEQRLKSCRTREEAEKVRAEKENALSTAAGEEGSDSALIRMAQMRSAEKAVMPVVKNKPRQHELYMKKEKARREKARREEKIRQQKEREKQRKKAARKKKIQQEILEEARQEKEILAQIQEEQYLDEMQEERMQMTEIQREEAAVYHQVYQPQEETELTDAQIIKMMTAAGMLDHGAMELRVTDVAGETVIPEGTKKKAPRGYAAYRAAADMPESIAQEGRKVYIRRA